MLHINFFIFNIETARDYSDSRLTGIMLKLCNFFIKLLHQPNTFFLPTFHIVETCTSIRICYCVKFKGHFSTSGSNLLNILAISV